MRFGLLGERLPYSYSPRIHSSFGNGDYGLLEYAPADLPAVMERRDWQGLNVTMPHKRAVIPWLDEMTETARGCGSVNTLVRRPDGTLLGENTDAAGLSRILDEAGFDLRNQKVLILGSGGTSGCARYVTEKAGGMPVIISRRGENRYDNLEKHRDAAYLINTTPVGMMPMTDLSPMDPGEIPSLRGVVDVIYNPWRTRLCQRAAALGIPCIGGLSMLCAQAAASHLLFTGQQVSEAMLCQVTRQLRNDTVSVVLIGMPGSGKTTLGRELARLLNRPFIDTDAAIEEKAGRSIPEIFRTDGEETFRSMEKEVIHDLCLKGGMVLAAGGGAPLLEANRQNLRQNGYVIELKRDAGRLSTEGRPLSKSLDTLRKMQSERAPYYAECADTSIDNNGTIEQGIQSLMEAVHEFMDH